MKITVVGAGIVGCAVAYELASRGARVQIVDPRGAGRGATNASAGLLAPHVESHTETFLRLGLCSLSLWDDFIRRVQADSGRHVDYDRSGTLHVALDSTHAAVLTDMAQAFQAAGVEHSLLDRRDALRLEPAVSDRALAALLIREHGYVAVQQMVDALLQAATRHGVELTTARVQRVEGDATQVAVITENATIHSDAVVVAAGSWTNELLSSHADVVKPIRGQLVHLQLDAPPSSRVVWGERCYLVPWPDGSVLLGATVEDVGFDERTTPEGVQGLLDAGIELMPALRGARVRDARAGLRPRTVDELPAIGPSSTMPHVFYAAGHYRNGVLLAPLTAVLIADLVLDGRERPELSDVRPDRFGL